MMRPRRLLIVFLCQSVITNQHVWREFYALSTLVRVVQVINDGRLVMLEYAGYSVAPARAWHISAL